MADPGHIGIVHSNNPTPIYFYTHFDGRYVNYLLEEGLKRALDADRLHDESYAARIVFDTLTGCTGGTISYGIHIGEPIWSGSPIPIPNVSWEGLAEHCGRWERCSQLEVCAEDEEGDL